MDFKQIMQQIGAICKKIWHFIAPYLRQLRQWRKRIWKKYQINKIILLTGLVAILVTTIYLFYLAKSANVETLKSGLEEATHIYDKDGDDAGTLYEEKGTFVKLDKIADPLKKAVVTTEDKRFYDHGAFDVKGIGRAFLGIITSGHISGGGSTLTQQLAKNAYLTQKQTFDRKAKELFLAIEIEKHYSKDEILEMYLNNSYFGNGVWGVEDAAHKYFGKSASEVNLSEAATLAGMLKGPNIYNPIDNMKYAVARRNVVLKLLADNNVITLATYKQTKAENIVLRDNYSESKQGYRYPYFFDAVISEAESRYHISESDILNRGYKIYTTLDQNYQKSMEASFQNDALFPPAAQDGTIVQGASVAINPKTGGVAAVVGGRGDHVFRGLNRALQSDRSPGSTMKPLAVYTPALEAGYKPEDMLKDEPLSYYNVQNYSKTYSGQVTMNQALMQSLNAPAVWLLHEIGVEKGVRKVEKFGIPLEKNDHYLGLALGGLTKGTTPLKMASAYTVFANQGVKIEPHFITKIVDASGAVVAEASPKETQVTTRAVSKTMTSMLQGVFSSGTGVNAQPYGYTMAGKTGTTENGDGGQDANDQWIIGYTPDVVVATWIGFDESNATHYLTGSSGTGVSTLFRDETQRILAYSPNTKFDVPDITQPTPSTNQSTDSQPSDGSDFTEKAKKFGQQVTEGAKYWGGKVKDKVGELWNQIMGN